MADKKKRGKGRPTDLDKYADLQRVQMMIDKPILRRIRIALLSDYAEEYKTLSRIFNEGMIFYVNLDKTLLDGMKERANDKNKSLESLLNELMKEYLEENK